MVPYKAGKANEGHSCVKGRFAYGYATHKDRILKPMIRERIEDPWREVSWDEAIALCGERIQAHPGAIRPRLGRRDLSSRCTNEEVFLVQKLVRVGFGNNNIDTCARVCHSPTGFGLSQTYGTSAGTQDFKSVEKADVVLVIGANPTDAHPVFASRLKKRLRAGARLIVIDPRRIDLVRSAHIEADRHLALKPGTNVAVLNALAHVVVTEGPRRRSLRSRALRTRPISNPGRASSPSRRHSPEATSPRRPALIRTSCAQAARLYATGGNAAIYYGLGVTEHARARPTVMAIANLAMATGNIGREGVGVNPLRGQNNVQGSCDMGSFPHEFSGYRHVSDDADARDFERLWGVELSNEPGLRIPNMMDEAIDGAFKGLYRPGRGHRPVRSRHQAHHRGPRGRWNASSCRISSSTRRARYAHVFLPGASFLEKDGTFTNAERRISRVRKAIAPLAGNGGLGNDDRARRGARRRRCATIIHARSWTRSPRRRRPSAACPTRGSTSSARSSGRATTRRRPARRSCMSTTSCAARASSC